MTDTDTKLTENLTTALIAHTIDDLEDITVFADVALDVDAIDLWYEVKSNPDVTAAFKTIAEAIMMDVHVLREIKLQEQANMVAKRFEFEVLPIIRANFEADGMKDYPARREAFCNFVDMLNKDGEITDYEAANIDIDTARL
jgi:hypothetical protein